MNVRALLQREDFTDAAVLSHGFADYMRDYEILVAGRDGPPQDDLHRYHFVGCAEAVCRTSLRPDVFATSLGDANVHAGPDDPDGEPPNGFIWGVRHSTAYPGLRYVENGERARAWSERLGRPMHEVTLETEAFHLRLVFADVRYQALGRETPETLPRKQLPISPPPPPPTSR